MAYAFQKIAIMTTALVMACVSGLTHAKLNACGQGSLVVSKKHVGQAQYFAENCKADWQTQAIEMQFSYTENIPEWAFKRAANFLLNRNIDNPNTVKALSKMTEHYQAVKNGDVYKLSYRPQSQALQLYLNGQNVAVLKHPDAVQYFSIWLGEKPFNTALKQQLLHTR